MANHPNRNLPSVIVYTRNTQGLIERHSIRGLTQDQHMDHYGIGPLTETERLVGWPERSVEWHGNTGYGIK